MARGTWWIGEREVMPAEGLAAMRKRGRPTANPKQQVTLRIDRDVLGCSRAEGPGWQSRINAALRRAAGLGD